MPRRFDMALLWRFELRESGANAEAGGKGDIQAVVSDELSSDKRWLRDVSSTVAMSPGVASAALPGRWLNEQHRQGQTALNKDEVHRARSCGGARII
jgi:hypothetical protein